MEYTHLKLGQDLFSLSGHYTPMQEEKLQYQGREVLYVTGIAVVDSSCCGVANFDYVLVPGYIVRWQHSKNELGLMVSEVEPVSGKKAKQEIKELLAGLGHTFHVEFW